MLRISSIAKHDKQTCSVLEADGNKWWWFRDRAIAEYHELLAADETLTSATFEKLRNAMRKNGLLYGDRPIGIALRPHLLDQKQFRALTLSAERVTSALEKVASAVVQDPT